MAPFDHFLMDTFSPTSPLVMKFRSRFLISGISSEPRSNRVRDLFGSLEDQLLVAVDPEQPHPTLEVGDYIAVEYAAQPADSVVKRILTTAETRGWTPDEIALDVTALPVEYSLMLVRGIRERMGASRLLIAYTEAASYASNIFTGGLKEINAIPGFIGSPDVSKPDLLVLLLGFEGHRSLSVYNKLDPEAVVAVNPFPALRPGWEQRSFTNNIEVIRKAHELKTCPANNPFAVVNALESIYDTYGSTYNINVSPLGVRTQAVGAAMFCMRHPDVRLVYHYPMEISQSIAVGCGTTWAFIVTYEDLVA